MKLPKITNKQQEIIELLYSYRFLNRIQIQSLLGHKDKKTINVWLKDLKAKQYIEWIYEAGHFAEKTKPAIYYIALNGVRYLKTVEADDNTGYYPLEEVRKRYREASRSRSFIDHCVLVADCCIALRNADDNGNATYAYVTIADYTNPGTAYFFLSESELVRPDLCFTKRQRKQEDEAATSCLLQIFDATLPRYRIKKRLKDYVEFLDNSEWQSETGDDESPIVLLICPRTSDLIYAKRRTRGLLAMQWEYGDENRPRMRFTTIENLKAQGVIQKIWEEA